MVDGDREPPIKLHSGIALRLHSGIELCTGLRTAVRHIVLDRPLPLRRTMLGLVVVLTLILATLTPLAHATPPDPTWIGGLYDNADYDDVIILATSSTSLTADSPVPTPEPLRIHVYVALFPTTQLVTEPDHRRSAPRGPPLV